MSREWLSKTLTEHPVFLWGIKNGSTWKVAGKHFDLLRQPVIHFDSCRDSAHKIPEGHFSVNWWRS